MTDALRAMQGLPPKLPRVSKPPTRAIEGRIASEEESKQ